MKKAVERIISRKTRNPVAEGLINEVHGDGTLTVTYGGRVRRLADTSGGSFVAGQRVTILQLEGYPEQAFVSGRSPKLPYTTRDVWV